MIELMTNEYSVQELCEALGASRSGYYAWKQPKEGVRSESNKQLIEEIERLEIEHKQRLGSPRMTRYLRRRGHRCGENRVARLMRSRGIAARRKRPFRPKTTQAGKIASPNILKELPAPTKPDRVWVSDITYVATKEGYLYLATVLDLHTRQIVGWKLEETMEAWIVEQAIERAVKRREPAEGMCFHSDRGVQYGSQAVRTVLASIGAIPSMSGKGNCYDNAYAESFFSTLKAECFPTNLAFDTKNEAQLVLFEYLEGYYNSKRLHSSLEYRTPDEFALAADKRVANTKISEQSAISDWEDRAMRGRNSSAQSDSNTVGRPILNLACRPSPTGWRNKAKNPRSLRIDTP